MTKIKSLLSMEKIVEIKDMVYSEKNLLDASKAMIDYKAEKATKELEENIDIEVRLAIQEALDDFSEIMFDIADNVVATEKIKVDKKVKKTAKKDKQEILTLASDINCKGFCDNRFDSEIKGNKSGVLS